MKVSICIPTYNRLGVLKQALESCLVQTFSPFEILVGDDSSNDETENWVTNICSNSPIPIKYFHHSPSLKQALNVDFLFQKVQGDLVLLLHDDDILTPTAVELLHNCFIKYPSIDTAYGKQYIMTDKGQIDIKKSEQLNKDYYRSLQYEGTKLTSLEAGILQQFPNDGYMIKSDIVRTIRYNSFAGDSCDFEFGLKLGTDDYKMYFLNEYTMNYRISTESISRKGGNNAALISFVLVQKLKVQNESLLYKEKWLTNKAPVAIANATNLNYTRVAFQIYFSRWHRKKILSLGGVKRFIFILYSFLKRNSLNKHNL